MSDRRSIAKFIYDAIAKDKALFFKVVVGRQGGLLEYTKYFAINERSQVLTYTIVNKKKDYSYKGNSRSMKNKITLYTVLCNYNGFYKAGKIIVITREDFEKEKPEELKLLAHMQLN